MAKGSSMSWTGFVRMLALILAGFADARITLM
jgi:hypothetical protein